MTTTSADRPDPAVSAAPATEADPALPAAGDAAVVRIGVSPGGVAGRLEDEALAQLRKLGDLREQELQRHELAMAEMRENARRHLRNQRILLALGLLLLGGVGAMAVLLRDLRRDQAATRDELTRTATAMAGLSTSVREGTAQQAQRLDGVTAAVEVNRQKLEAYSGAIASKVDDSVMALRQERDAITGTLKLALEDQNRKLVEREITVRANEQRVQAESERTQKERQRIIQETIQKLSAITDLPPPSGAPPAR